MKWYAYVIIALVASSCKDSTYYREKHGLIKTRTVTFTINSIRVDDDAEYHLTASSDYSGRVMSIYDARADGWVNDELIIKYGYVDHPIMEVVYDDAAEAGVYREKCCIPKRVTLPTGYKIQTFDD